jgi:hypothetical protein
MENQGIFNSNYQQNQAGDRFSKIVSLTIQAKYKLSSPDLARRLEPLRPKYQIDAMRLGSIINLIEQYYFEEIRLDDFPAEIEKRVGVSLFTAQEITRFIKQEIIDWNPWAEYLAKLPKMTVREIAQNRPRIAAQEITKGYIELRDSEDLEDPTIKNWIKDYVAHLGYDNHTQMQRTQYLFHSENGRNLDSQDREKLGIILKSFDENIPLPVDEENQEIMFDSMINERPPVNNIRSSPNNSFAPQSAASVRPEPPQQEPFANSYSAPSTNRPAQPQRTSAPSPVNSFSPSTRPPSNPAIRPAEQQRFAPQTPNHAPLHPIRTSPQIPEQPSSRSADQPTHPNMISHPSGQFSSEIGKRFNASESPLDPQVKIHSITERNEPKISPATSPNSVAPRPVAPQPKQEHRTRHMIINPFFSEAKPEPKLDGNIVDLSGE